MRHKMKSRKCKHCGYEGSMILLSSIDKMMCPECKKYNKWKLKPNQASVLIEGKTGGIK